MSFHYYYNGKVYHVYYDDENKGFLRFVVDPGKTVFVRVYDSCEFSIKVNKKSVSAKNGALGAFCFFADSVKNDFMTVFLNRVINNTVEV